MTVFSWSRIKGKQCSVTWPHPGWRLAWAADANKSAALKNLELLRPLFVFVIKERGMLGKQGHGHTKKPCLRARTHTHTIRQRGGKCVKLMFPLDLKCFGSLPVCYRRVRKHTRWRAHGPFPTSSLTPHLSYAHMHTHNHTHSNMRTAIRVTASWYCTCAFMHCVCEC